MPTVNDDYPIKNTDMSDEQVKAMATEQFAHKETETQKFPTEIIDLPSKGLLYPDGHPLRSGKIEMKYMTAREEDILTTQSYIKQGVVLDKLFRALIVGNGEGVQINYGDLLTGDKNAVMIAARVLGYGKDYTIKVQNPSGTEQEEKIDLTKFEHKELREDLITPGTNEFEFELPASKRTVTFKILNHRDSLEIDKEIKSLQKIKDQYGSKQLTTRLFHTITSVDGDESKSAIRNFVKNELLAIDSRALRDFIAEISPDVDLKIDLFDAENGELFSVNMPIGVDFFWPSV